MASKAMTVKHPVYGTGKVVAYRELRDGDEKVFVLFDNDPVDRNADWFSVDDVTVTVGV